VESAAWRSGSTYLCQGVSWTTGEPCLDVVDVTSATAAKVPLFRRRIGLRAAAPGRFCIGRFAFVDETGTQNIPCPDQAPAADSDQCAQCAARDEFRFAHHFHTGGHAPPALVTYMAQPHWLYIATFGDATSKVGTAAHPRKKSRLDEQGAVLATYIAYAGSGRDIRIVEDSVTRNLSVPQTRRRSAKVAALADPLPRAQVLGAHTRLVTEAAALVDGRGRGLDVRPVREDWVPPRETEPLLATPPSGGWVAYPHNLRDDEHGFFVDGIAGPAVLARTTESDDPLHYVVDLGVLKGCRVTAGDFVSPESQVQVALF
jgi:Protein of unknown function (DUF2797)